MDKRYVKFRFALWEGFKNVFKTFKLRSNRFAKTASFDLNRSNDVKTCQAWFKDPETGKDIWLELDPNDAEGSLLSQLTPRQRSLMCSSTYTLPEQEKITKLINSFSIFVK